MSSVRLACGVALVAACLLGCGNVKLPESLEGLQKSATETAQSIGNTASNAVNNAANAVKSQTDPGSVTSIEVQAESLVAAPTCYASFVAPAGRSALLHVSSYSTPASEGYPSIMILAPSGATQASGLAGQQVLGEVYVQNEKDGAVWKSPDGDPATIKITAADDSAVAGEILSGTLVNASTGASKPASGKFRAAWRP